MRSRASSAGAKLSASLSNSLASHDDRALADATRLGDSKFVCKIEIMMMDRRRRRRRLAFMHR